MRGSRTRTSWCCCQTYRACGSQVEHAGGEGGGRERGWVMKRGGREGESESSAHTPTSWFCCQNYRAGGEQLRHES